MNSYRVIISHDRESRLFQCADGADRSQQIYQERFQAAFEQAYSGRYVIIDILAKNSYVAVSVEETIDKAKAEAPDGLFHLIRLESAALRTSIINS